MFQLPIDFSDKYWTGAPTLMQIQVNDQGIFTVLINDVQLEQPHPWTVVELLSENNKVLLNRH